MKITRRNFLKGVGATLAVAVSALGDGYTATASVAPDPEPRDVHGLGWSYKFDVEPPDNRMLYSNGVAKTEEKTDYEPPGTVQWSYAYHVIGEEPGEAPDDHMHYSYGIDVAGDMDSYIRQALLHQCDLYRIERENELLYGDGTAQPLGVFYVDEEVE